MSALPIQLSIHLGNVSPELRDWAPMLELARLADRAGIDRVAVSDHILLGERLDAYADPRAGGMEGAVQPTDSDGHWLEPLTVLSVLAGITTTVRLSTGILLAALRPAAVLAKQAATLDVLSGGRLDLGTGVGWQREEYEACGLDFHRRGELLDTTLDRCRRLWTEDVVDHDADGLRFDRIHAQPKPVQAGGVPIWVSGRATERTARRLTRFGMGWIPWGDDIADPRPGIDRMRRALAAADRDPATLQVQGSLAAVLRDGDVDLDATLAPVPDLVDAGITDFRLWAPVGRDLDADADLFGHIVPAFRQLVGRT